MPPTRRSGPLCAALLAAMLAGCRSAGAPPTDLPDVPEVLSTRVVFAPRCRGVFFSSNRDDHMAAYRLDLSGEEPAVSPVAALRGRGLLVRSASPDCALLALVADRGGDDVFDVFLYDTGRRKLEPLTRTRRVNEGDPEFSPARPLLAYLADERLALYDYRARRAVPVPESPARFVSLKWSADGGRVLLEDRGTHLWEYAPSREAFRMVWEAPRRAYSPRLPHASGDSLYFVSDHETGLTQIYLLDLATSGMRRVHPSPHDQYSPRPRADGLLFRTSIDGNVAALRLRDGDVDTLSPPLGVVYDLSLDFPSPLLVYAGEREVASIYAGGPAGSGGLTDLLSHDFAIAQPPARELRTAEGMVHFVYAADSAPARWVVWLHGGPREQVSPRFNLYFDFLARLGYGVVAVNYPGSTGIGNEYELAGVPLPEQVERQLAGIDEALALVKNTYPGFDRYALVGVSYGSAIGFLHLRRHPDRVLRFVDFSGVTTRSTAPDLGGVRGPLPPVLLIHGANDAAQRSRERRTLLRARGRLAPTTRVVLQEEGHFVARRSSIRLILAHLRQFLADST